MLGLGSAPALAAGKQAKPATVKKQALQKVSAKKRATAVMEDYSTLRLYSNAVMVLDQSTGSVLYEKNSEAVLPIASITKLMMAMVALDAPPDLDEILQIDEDDVDTLKGTHSRLRVGTRLSREEMLRLALMSSENRAAFALSRYYPGGRPAFVAAMNRKAQMLGLQDTYFSDPTGLSAENVSSARDLARMVSVAQQYPLIRQFSTTSNYEVAFGGRTHVFNNTNSLVRSSSWDIGLSKTGFINEAGRCLVMQAWFNNKPTIIVLLDSIGKMTRIGDANRIKHWVENGASSLRHSAS
ncbi:D-alanyl-D-alanine endopeptidase [Sterolibacterium denitrificans]|nr:D-alanyl-D-alanine endopeptidase [Sterolibacterium denitrificans]